MLVADWLSAAQVEHSSTKALEYHHPTATLLSYRSIVLVAFALAVRRKWPSGQIRRRRN